MRKGANALNSKGIFTVTQLSYTFRPRRRPKRLRDKREKYHHALKALAIRENKIHVAGSPELKLNGTPVYLDVEGLPDRDFYYLIGARVKTADGVFHHSFWSDDFADEKKAWGDFLALIGPIEKPVLIHYGSFETAFFQRMRERYGEPADDSSALKVIQSAINLVSVIFAQVYFPAYSNKLKDIASYLGFVWSEANPSGLAAIVWRHSWEVTKSLGMKDRLLNYNAEDCQALERVALSIVRLGATHSECEYDSNPDSPVVHTELLPKTDDVAEILQPG